MISHSKHFKILFCFRSLNKQWYFTYQPVGVMWMCLKLIWALWNASRLPLLKVSTSSGILDFRRNMCKLLKRERMLRKPLTTSPFTPRSAEILSPWDCLLEFGKWGQSLWRFRTIQTYILYMFQESLVVNLWILSMILLVHTWFGISPSDIIITDSKFPKFSSNCSVLCSRCDVRRYIGVLLLSVGTFWNKAHDVLQNLGFQRTLWNWRNWPHEEVVI